MSKPARKRPSLSPGTYATAPVMPVVADTPESPAWAHLAPWIATTAWLEDLRDADLARLLDTYVQLHVRTSHEGRAVLSEAIKALEGHPVALSPAALGLGLTQYLLPLTRMGTLEHDLLSEAIDRLEGRR